ADADYQEALKILGELSGRPDVSLECARIEINRATLRLVLIPPSSFILPPSTKEGRPREQDLEQARQGCERAIDILDKLLADNPQEAGYANELGRAYTNLGLVLVAQKELGAALCVYVKAVELFADLHKRYELAVDYKHLLAVARGNLGLHLLRLG